MFLFFIFGTLRMLVRPAMKRLFCLKAKNGLGRFAPSALPHYNTHGGKMLPQRIPWEFSWHISRGKWPHGVTPRPPWLHLLEYAIVCAMVFVSWVKYPMAHPVALPMVYPTYNVMGQMLLPWCIPWRTMARYAGHIYVIQWCFL